MKRLLFLAMIIPLANGAMDNLMDTQVKPIKVGTKRSAQEEIEPEAKAPRTESYAIANPQIKVSEKSSVPIIPYYTEKNLEDLAKKGIQRHAPCLILLDPINADNDRTLSNNLTDAIRKMEFPIIASTALMHSVVSKAADVESLASAYKDRYKNLPLTFSNWNIHITPNSHFVILIPKKFSKIYPDLGLKTSSNLNISKLLPGAQKGKEKVVSLAELQEDIAEFPQNWDDPNFYQQLFKDFSRIFFTKNEFDQQKLPIWDIIINGHGSFGHAPLIAALSPDNINNILSFFDTNLNVGSLLVISCFAGGQNLNLLEFEKFGVSHSHPYIMIVASSDDAPTAVGPAALLPFFNLAAFLNDKGSSLNQLLLSIANINLPPSETSNAVHNVEFFYYSFQNFRIPQVWLPNGFGFQTFNIDQYVSVVGNVSARIAEENQRPIILNDKMAILAYPSIITTPIDILLLVQQNPHPYNFLKQKSYFQNLPLPHERKFLDFASDFASNTKTKNELFKKLYLDKKAPQAQYVIYPQFISMIRGNSTQFIKKISLDSREAVGSGVIHFIRDSFLDIGRRGSTKIFLIEELIGNNDISDLLETARVIKKIANPHPLENVLVSKKNQPITLGNIIISSVYDWQMQQEVYEVTFAIGSTAWTFNSDDVKNLWPRTIAWNFRNINSDVHDKQFTKMRQELFAQKSQTLPQPGQKTISETLKKKQEAIELRKALEIKQKEAAEQAIRKYKEMQRPQS